MHDDTPYTPREKVQPAYVLTNTGEYLVQLPDDGNAYGFLLADDDQTWDGGIGAASSWEIVPTDQVPADVRERLGFLLEQER